MGPNLKRVKPECCANCQHAIRSKGHDTICMKHDIVFEHGANLEDQTCSDHDAYPVAHWHKET